MTLDIRGGGAVAVDTETLRATAALFVGAGSDLEALSERIGSLQLMLLTERDVATDAASAASVLSTRLVETMREAVAIADALRAAAVVYELVDLNARHATAFLAGDDAAMRRIDARRDALMADHPGAMEQARGAEFERAVMWPSELVRQHTEIGFSVGRDWSEVAAIYGGAGSGLATLGLGALVGVGGWGRLAREAKLAPGPRGAVVTPVAPPTPATAPTTLTAVAARVPRDGDTRVRVERYRMPDGTREYAVYVSGTQSFASPGGAEPWDVASNVDLYAGKASASYQATQAALDAAGARPGDVVHAFGHSQGAMIASHLALDGGYDTRTLVAFGSPVEADVGPGTLSVGVRHTDDPVAALAGGGHAAPVGAPGSFVAERVADPAAGIHDAKVPAHGMAAYLETAALIDASTDPRVDAVRGTFAHLGSATSIDAVEFSAEREEAP